MAMMDTEWIGVVGEEEVLRGDTEGYVRQQMRQRGYSEEDFEVLAVPKRHWGIWL